MFEKKRYYLLFDDTGSVDTIFKKGISIGNDDYLVLQYSSLNGINNFASSFNPDITELIKNKDSEKIIENVGQTTGYIVKIPEKYFDSHMNGAVLPIPFVYRDIDKVYRIMPNLIQGCYDPNKQAFITNKNYNPIYDPSGLYFHCMQLEAVLKKNPAIYDWCLERNKRIMSNPNTTIEEQNSGFWNNSINYYKSQDSKNNSNNNRRLFR